MHVSTPELPDFPTDQLYEKFCQLFRRLKLSVTPQDIRRKSLLKHKMVCNTLQTTQTCLWCLIRPAERALRCGHCLCEGCLEEYYSPGPSVYSYRVDCCLICGLNVNMVLKIKPPTAMPSILSIDGGGVRGIAGLVLMKRVQEALDVPWPLWRFFDIVVGTSVGE